MVATYSAAASLEHDIIYFGIVVLFGLTILAFVTLLVSSGPNEADDDNTHNDIDAMERGDMTDVIQCAAGIYCEGQDNPNLTLGDHGCCKCQKFAHGICVEELEDRNKNISAEIKAKFATCKQKGMSKDVCLQCIQKARDELENQSPTPATSDSDVDDEKCRKHAALEVLNMTRLFPTVFPKAKQLAKKVGWNEKQISRFLKHSENWKPTKELARNHQPDNEDLGEEPNLLSNRDFRNNFRTDVQRFIKASRAGQVRLCSWYDNDEKYVIIIRLPLFKKPEIDFYRCEFLHELLPGEFITLFHNSIVNYHQQASYALKEKWVCGFNAHHSPYNFDFYGNRIDFKVKPLFEAVYTEVQFTDKPSKDHRDKVPSPEQLKDRIGEKRYDDLVTFCRINHICDLPKYLRENQGTDALMPGLWLSLEALIVSPHLFKVFDEMQQDWERRRNQNNANDQDEEEKREEEEEEAALLEGPLDPELVSSKRKEKVIYKNNYDLIDKMSEDYEDFVYHMKEFLNRDDGIMKMKRGELEPDALGLWETRGHVYATLNLFLAVEFFLTRQDRARAYGRSEVFEVDVLRKESMDDAGAEPLTWATCNHKARMKFAVLIDHNIMIKPGNCRRPLTGMTAVVYKDDEKCEAHRIILD